MKIYNVSGWLLVLAYALACMYFAPTDLGPWLGLLIAVPLFGGIVATACDGDGGGDNPTGESATSSGVSGDITVFAASSLTDAFQEIGGAFRNGDPWTGVGMANITEAARKTMDSLANWVR